MEKTYKKRNDAFVVREDFSGKRTVITSSDGINKLAFSSLKGKVVAASYNNKIMDLSFGEYFTFNNDVVRGFVSVDYTITNPLEYSYQKYTEKIIDVVLRSILDKYFHEINFDKHDNLYEATNDEINSITILANYYLSKIIPHVKINSISKIVVDRTKTLDNAFRIKDYEEISKEEDVTSFDIEYYKPYEKYVSDEIDSSKEYYPYEVYVPHNSLLVYRGNYKFPGTYIRRSARGTIVSEGKHVLSLSPRLYKTGKDENEFNKYMVYPNVIYNVTNLPMYVEYDVLINNLLQELSNAIIDTCFIDQSEVQNIIAIKDIPNTYIKNIIENLNKYEVAVEYIVFTTKNPCVRSKQRIKKVSDMFSEIFKENR